MPHDLPVLAGAGLRLVGVDDEVVRAPVRLLGHERPLEAGREAGAAAAAQARLLHLVDDPVAAHLEQELGAVPGAALLRGLQARRVQAVEVGEDAILIGEHVSSPSSARCRSRFVGGMPSACGAPTPRIVGCGGGALRGRSDCVPASAPARLGLRRCAHRRAARARAAFGCAVDSARRRRPSCRRPSTGVSPAAARWAGASVAGVLDGAAGIGRAGFGSAAARCSDDAASALPGVAAVLGRPSPRSACARRRRASRRTGSRRSGSRRRPAARTRCGRSASRP